jgi:hypothetical protein
MQYSSHAWAIFILLLMPLMFVLLFAPFHFFLNLSKKGSLIQGCYRLTCFGMTLGKAEILPQSAADLLASIAKDRESAKETAKETEFHETEKIKTERETQKTNIVLPPGIQSLANAAPAILNILGDLFKLIIFKKLSCRLCLGLDDPAHTAIISGGIWLLTSALGLMPGKISIEPCFEGERLEGELIAEIEARLLWAAYAMIKALRAREIRLLLREMLG